MEKLADISSFESLGNDLVFTSSSGSVFNYGDKGPLYSGSLVEVAKRARDGNFTTLSGEKLTVLPAVDLFLGSAKTSLMTAEQHIKESKNKNRANWDGLRNCIEDSINSLKRCLVLLDSPIKYKTTR